MAKPTPVFAVRLEAALRVKPFVSKEEARYYLNGICIEPAEGGAVCVATDGHRLGARFDKGGLAVGSTITRLPNEIKMPPKLLASPWLVGMSTGNGKGHISVVEAATQRDEEDTAERAIARVEDCLLRVGHAFINGTFPDWRRVIPEAADEDAVRGFNGLYFKDFGKYVTIRGRDEASPHLVRIHDDPDFVGVLMPMRTDKQAVPAWLARPAATPAKKAA